MYTQLVGLTLIENVQEPGDAEALLPKGHNLTATDVLWLVDLGFTWQYLDSIAKAPTLKL